jgi:hypothetical protein
MYPQPLIQIEMARQHNHDLHRDGAQQPLSTPLRSQRRRLKHSSIQGVCVVLAVFARAGVAGSAARACPGLQRAFAAQAAKQHRAPQAHGVVPTGNLKSSASSVRLVCPTVAAVRR